MMSELFTYIAWAISAISLILAFIVLRYFKVLSGFMKYFGIWILSGTFFEVTSSVLAQLEINNLFLFHFYALAEFTIIILFFDSLYREFHIQSLKKILLPGIVMIILNSIFFQSFEMMNSDALSTISLLVIIFCMYYFFNLLGSKHHLYEVLLRLIPVGSVFITHCCYLIPSLFGTILFEVDEKTQLLIWLLRGFVVFTIKTIMLYILLTHYYKPIKSV